MRWKAINQPLIAQKKKITNLHNIEQQVIKKNKGLCAKKASKLATATQKTFYIDDRI